MQQEQQRAEREQQQLDAVRAMTHRLLPGHVASRFTLELLVIGNSSTNVSAAAFALHNDGHGGVRAGGTDGVALASGVHHYLRFYANTSFSWLGDNLGNLPPAGEPLPPLPAAGVLKSTRDQWRFYLNFCTFGYSTVWWDEARWTRELDWAALNGVNLVVHHFSPVSTGSFSNIPVPCNLTVQQQQPLRYASSGESGGRPRVGSAEGLRGRPRPPSRGARQAIAE